MKLKTVFINLIVFTFILTIFTGLFPKFKQFKQFRPEPVYAYVCDPGATLHDRGCSGNPCYGIWHAYCYCNDTESCCADCYCETDCNCDNSCCYTIDGNWGTCSATTLKQTCGTAGNTCGAGYPSGNQNCTPAGGTKTCCSVGATATFSADYPGTAAVVSPFGPANGTLNITGGTTTVTGATLVFNVLNVSTGYISVTSTGIAKTSATCVN